MKLTDLKCKNAKPLDKPYKLSDGEGMYLDVRTNGSKYWRLKYRYNKKEKLLALGVYPETSLSEARELKIEARKLIKQGIDPSLRRKVLKVSREEDCDNTFEIIARAWWERHKKTISPKYATTIINRLERDVFPFIGSLPINDVTPRIFLDVIRRVEKRGNHEIAKKIYQSGGQIFRYAIIEGKAERDITSDLKGSLEPYKKGHYASIEIKEIPELIRDIEINKPRLYPQTILATKLLMLTFVRTNELVKARWDEFDFEDDIWLIPAERMKMKKAHLVPLAKQTKDILLELREQNEHWGWVLPGIIRPRNPMSNNTILKGLESLGYKGRMTGHGFRSLAMSAIKEKLGYRHEVIDRQLAHVPANEVDRAYDRAMFIEDRAKMMQDWADYLDRFSLR